MNGKKLIKSWYEKVEIESRINYWFESLINLMGCLLFFYELMEFFLCK